MKILKIRRMSGEDNSQVEKLIKTSLEAADLAIEGTAYTDPEIGHLYEHYASIPNSAFWVIEGPNKQIVACGGYAPLEGYPQVAELQKFYVDKRVRRQGLGKKLLQGLISQCASHYTYLYLETHHFLAAAASLYEAFDFEALSHPMVETIHPTMDKWYIKKLKD